MQLTFSTQELLPSVETILTHLLFEADLLEDRPTFPEWSRRLFDTPDRERTNDDEWVLYRRSLEQAVQFKRLLGEGLFANCLTTYRRLEQGCAGAHIKPPPVRVARDLMALTFRSRPVLLAAGGPTELGEQVLVRLREERKAPHEEYRLAEEYILGGDHLEALGEAAVLTWLQRIALPLREWRGRERSMIVAILPESLEIALKTLFFLHDSMRTCPYCVILDAHGQVKRLFDPRPRLLVDAGSEGSENS